MDESSSGRGSTSSVPSGSGKPSSSKELEQIDQLFYRYANESSGVIEPDGIELLSSDLRLAHRDLPLLMLAWKMKAQKRGYFTQEEWRRGLTALRADTIVKLQRALPDLWKEVNLPYHFVKLYSYAFTYSLTEKWQKTIDTETICDMLDVILGPFYQPQVNTLIHYLKGQRDYWMITLDQWMGFYRFCKEVNFPDLSNYDPNHAWPLILDNFVEWMKSKRS